MKKLKVLFAAIICFSCVYAVHAKSECKMASISNDDVKIIGKSTNNDKYWYGRYVYAKFDSNGNPITDSYKYIYPKNDCSYEIRFAYSENTNCKFPVYIYLNEINEKGVVKSELIGSINRNIKSSVKFKSDGVDIFTPDRYVHVHIDGMIILYETKNGSYANCINKIFNPTEAASVIYKVRYDVLIDKLKKVIK